MTALQTKILMCSIRTLGVVAGLWILGTLIRYFEIDYEDVKTVLGIINAYAPELVLIGLLFGAGFAFYKSTIDENKEFDFMHFFMADKPEDIFRLGYFMLLLVAMWSIFALIWRDKMSTEYAGVVFGAFIVKNIGDAMGKAFGKPRE